MVSGKKRRKAGKALLGNHQRCWLWGRHAVMETLRAGRWLPLEVAVDSHQVAEEIQKELRELCALHRVELTVSTASEMQKYCGTGEHQGLMAKMPPYPYVDIKAVLQRLSPESAVLVLAGIQDPFNFGSILRSADLFGIDAVIVPISGQAPVSSHVARSSVGAVNFLKIAQVDNLQETCRELAAFGLQMIAATERGTQRPDAVDLTQGFALVIGNEGAGIPESLLHLCGTHVCIPIGGHVDSLNAAVATGILCYEATRQRMVANPSA